MTPQERQQVISAAGSKEGKLAFEILRDRLVQILAKSVPYDDKYKLSSKSIQTYMAISELDNLQTACESEKKLQSYLNFYVHSASNRVYILYRYAILAAFVVGIILGAVIPWAN